MDFYWERTKKNPQNFIVKCITVMNRKHLPRVCCTRSWIFCHLSYFVFLKFRISQAWYKFFYTGFISSLLTFFQRFLFYESAHLEMQYPLRTQERSHMDHVNRIKLGLDVTRLYLISAFPPAHTFLISFFPLTHINVRIFFHSTCVSH